MKQFFQSFGSASQDVILAKPLISNIDIARGNGDYFMVMTYGQSLSINGTAVPTVRPSRNSISTFNYGVNSTPDGSSYLVPLRPQNDIVMGAIEIFDKYDTPDGKYLCMTTGIGGAQMSLLQKGSGGYNKTLEVISQGVRVAELEGVNLIVPAYYWVHGEQDTLSNQNGINQDYKGAMMQLARDLNTDIKAITGQVQDVIMLTDSLASSSRYGRYPNLAMDMVFASRQEPLIEFGSAMYQSDYWDEFNVHGSTQLYHLIGCSFGKRQLDVLAGKGNGLVSLSHTYSNLKSTITFNVPYSPLVLDTTQVQNLADGFYGFKLFDRYLDPNDSSTTGGGNSTISEPLASVIGVQIVGNTVEITYDQDPTGSYITYGVNGTGWEEVDGLLNNPNYLLGRENGARGNLRDSQGDDIHQDIYDKNGVLQHQDISNFCGIFEFLIS